MPSLSLHSPGWIEAHWIEARLMMQACKIKGILQAHEHVAASMVACVPDRYREALDKRAHCPAFLAVSILAVIVSATSCSAPAVILIIAAGVIIFFLVKGIISYRSSLLYRYMGAHTLRLPRTDTNELDMAAPRGRLQGKNAIITGAAGYDPQITRSINTNQLQRHWPRD